MIAIVIIVVMIFLSDQLSNEFSMIRNDLTWESGCGQAPEVAPFDTISFNGCRTMPGSRGRR